MKAGAVRRYYGVAALLTYSMTGPLRPRAGCSFGGAIGRRRERLRNGLCRHCAAAAGMFLQRSATGCMDVQGCRLTGALIPAISGGGEVAEWSKALPC